jgi:hypothetical protein
MIKKSIYFSFIVITGLATSVWAGTYSGGTGTEQDPYLISSATDMNEIGAEPNDWDKYFALTADIDLSSFMGTQFNIIGNDSNAFTGVFDGNGWTVSNFTYTTTGMDNIGLFGYVHGVNAEIKNLGLIAPNVDGGAGAYIGALVGVLEDGTISGCGIEDGSVSGSLAVGGLVGRSDHGTISNCYTTDSVSGDWFTGGLVGWNYYSAISNCYTTGSVLEGEGSYTGGLVGYHDNSSYTKCFWDNTINSGLTGVGNISDPPDVIGESTTNMQTESTFTNAGWDFTSPIWIICEGIDYPRLGWEGIYWGNGTAEEPFLICTWHQMNSVGLNPDVWDKHFELIADINLSSYTGTQFNMIGRPIDPLEPNEGGFTGTFNGNGHTISNFSYSSPGTNYIGIFACMNGTGAAITNLGLIDPNIDNVRDEVGALLGRMNDGTISYCYVVGGSILGNESIGGLVGYKVKGTISNCYTTTLVSGYYRYVGGLVGDHSLGTISDCYATGNILGNRAGGLVGDNYRGTILDCYAKGSVSGEYSVGGLLGRNQRADALISGCYAMGNVDGNDYAGGLVGYNEGIVSNSYAAGDVSGITCTGGLVGWIYGDDANVSNCYATGYITGDANVGGLVGYDYGAGYYTKSFCDTTRNPSIEGIGNKTDPNVIGKSTADMQKRSTFNDAGWDFVEIWDIGEEQTYPFLRTYPVCPGDLNNDGQVDWLDFAVLADNWLVNTH